MTNLKLRNFKPNLSNIFPLQNLIKCQYTALCFRTSASKSHHNFQNNKHELTTSTEGHVSPFSQNSLSDCKSSGWTNQVNSTLILCGTLIRSTSVEPSGCRSDTFFTRRCFPLICPAMSDNYKRVI